MLYLSLLRLIVLMHIHYYSCCILSILGQIQGRIQGGGGGGGAPGARPPKIGKNMICWRKIVIFHTKYPKNFRASLRSAHFF
jgi:hypothetical protein